MVFTLLRYTSTQPVEINSGAALDVLRDVVRVHVLPPQPRLLRLEAEVVAVRVAHRDDVEVKVVQQTRRVVLPWYALVRLDEVLDEVHRHCRADPLSGVVR